MDEFDMRGREHVIEEVDGAQLAQKGALSIQPVMRRLHLCVRANARAVQCLHATESVCEQREKRYKIIREEKARTAANTGYLKFVFCLGTPSTYNRISDSRNEILD